MAARRGPREDSIYYDHKTPCRDPDEHRRCTGSWRDVVSLGYGPDGKRIRRKVRGQTKTEVRDKLRDLHIDIEAGLRKPEAVTLREAAEDWLTHGLDGRSAKTVRKNRDVLTAVPAVIGRRGCMARYLSTAAPSVTSSVVLSRCTVPMTASLAIGDNGRQSACTGLEILSA